jgi:hypothetical protein
MTPEKSTSIIQQEKVTTVQSPSGSRYLVGLDVPSFYKEYKFLLRPDRSIGMREYNGGVTFE